MDRTSTDDLVFRAAEEADMDQVAALVLASDDSLVCSAAGLRHFHRTHLERVRRLDLVVELDGAVVGLGQAGRDPNTSTEGSGWAFVTVRPDRRRRGIGDALGRLLLEHLHSLGVRRATAFMRATEEGERWAGARGWSRVLTGPLIALDPRGLAKPAPKPGFRCLAMSEVSPEAVYEAVCEAAQDEPTVVPNDDFRFDQFLRTWEDPDADLDASTAVVDDADRVVAFAFMSIVGANGRHGFTGTVRAQRGRGLATAAKRRALHAAAARGVTRVTTSNAEENAAMRAINRRLGFEPIGEHVILARDL